MGRCPVMSFVTETPVKERAWSAGASALIVALVGWGLVSGLRVSPFVQVQRALSLIDIATPPPAKPQPKPKVEHRVAEAAKGKPAPANLRNKATPIVAPPPPPIPAPPPVITAPKPNIGTAPQTGASDRAGPGEGAGGEGNGNGGGGDGGDGDIPPRQTKGHLSFSDLPADLRSGFSGGTVGVRYSVETDGHVGDCRVTRSSGKRELDQLTCQLIQQRFRFKPSRDGDNGEPVRSWIVENHSWDIDRDGYDEPSR
jgi:periplasmic protein TonB